MENVRGWRPMTSTTPTLPATEVLKQDRRGRVRTPVDRREALLDEFERSGVSGAEFARLAGLKYSSFQNWVQMRRRARRQAGELVPARRAPAPGGANLTSVP